MKKKRSFLMRLLPWVIVAAAIAALIVFVFVPIYSEKEEPISEPPIIYYYDGPTGKIAMENDFLKFEMDRADTTFSLTDKRTGKVWYSNPQDRASDKLALSVNKENLSSTLNVTYTTSGGEVEMNNFAYSQQNQNYQILEQEDGSVRVDYAIGKIERTYMMPTVITAERYKAFTDAMSKSTKKKVGSNYTLYEPATLDKKDNKDELIEMYPSITEQSLYILKSDTNATNKAKVEGYFAEVNYTQEDLELDNSLMAKKADTNGPVFNASIIYRLDGSEFVVEVPYDSFRCRNDYPITYVSVLPMFGAAGTSQEGFMLVPEGGGAIINNNNGKVNQNPYYANLYGWDYATERTEAVSETRNAFPVFGMSQDDSSFICVIEGASAYAGISADISGRYNSYNTVYAKYNVLHYDRFNVSARTAQLLYMYENGIPQDDVIVQRYCFLGDSSYTAMAAAYGEYLRRDPMMAASTAGEEMPVNVELVGAIDKKVPVMGVPVDKVVSTTSFAEAQDIISELTSSGVKDLTVRMTGWSNGGVRQQVLTKEKPVRSMGGSKGMNKLISYAEENGVRLFFDGINCFAYDSGFTEGFIPFSHAARYTTREQIKLYPFSTVTHQLAEWMDVYYLARPDYAKKNASNLISALGKRGAAGVAFRDIGNLLSADYYKQNTVTREQTKAMNVETLNEAKQAGLMISIKEGNDYAVPYADLITDMNLTGNSYAIFDSRVPFYQIALHGIKDYTSESINLSSDYQTTLLECAEYGAGLSFTFMKTDTPILADTAYSCYTSAAYDRWKDELIPVITRYQSEMAGLNRTPITGHEEITDGLTVTEYEDGTKVYVNYTTVDYTVDGVTVGARDYKVERGSAQ